MTSDDREVQTDDYTDSDRPVELINRYDFSDDSLDLAEVEPAPIEDWEQAGAWDERKQSAATDDTD